MTGAAGCVGRHLTAHLAACGDDVVGTDRSEGGPDLLDPAGLARLVAEVDPEVVFHLAGQADVGGSWEAPADTLRVNAEGTLHLLEAVRSTSGARVVTVTSADVYGVVRPEDLPLDETAPLRPVSPYAASKAAADLLALQAYLGHGMDVVRVRSFNHLGPGQDDRFVCSALAARIAAAEAGQGDEVRVGNLAARRDFTDVRDVVRAYRCLAIDGRCGGAMTRPSTARGTAPTCGVTRRCCGPTPVGNPRWRWTTRWPTCWPTGDGAFPTPSRQTGRHDPPCSDHRHHRPGRLVPG